MREKILSSLMRPWLVAGAATIALAGPVAADFDHVEQSATGPRVWGNMTGYDACGYLDAPGTPDQWWTGADQSPVNIEFATSVPGGSPLEFYYSDTPLVVANTGHAIEVPYAAGNELRIGTDVFELKKLEFHTMSEHNYLGQQYDMEVHLVHQNTLGETAIVAVFLQTGATGNDLVGPVFQNAQAHWGNSNSVTVPGASVNALALLPHATPITSGGTTGTGDAGASDTTATDQSAEPAPSVKEVKKAWKEKKKTWREEWRERKESWRQGWRLRWQEFKASLYELLGKGKAAQQIRRAARLEYRKARELEKVAMKNQRKAERRAMKEARKNELRAARERARNGGGDPEPTPDPVPDPVVIGAMADTYFAYMGSLTMPPCTTGVRWYVLPHVVDVSAASVQTMKDMVLSMPVHMEYWIDRNNRPIQPLNGRTIQHIQP